MSGSGVGGSGVGGGGGGGRRQHGAPLQPLERDVGLPRPDLVAGQAEPQPQDLGFLPGLLARQGRQGTGALLLRLRCLLRGRG